MMKLTWLLLTIMVLSYVCDAYKILVVFPMPGKSHSILGEGYVRHLLEAGHEITYVTPFPMKNTNPKLRQISTEETFSALPDFLNIKKIMNKEVNSNDMTTLFLGLLNVTYMSIENSRVQQLVNDPKETFDVVIVEWMFSEFLSGLSAVFNCPYIWSASTDPHWMILSLIDESTNPAYTSDIQSSNIPPLSFTQRLQELWSQIMMYYLREYVFFSTGNEYYQKIYQPILAKRGRPLPPFQEVRYNASMVIGNAHVSLGQAMRLPQNFVSVGGYHIDAEVKPLPEDLRKIIESAKNGVIYFSMGSNLKSKEMPDELKNSLLKMFGTLKYTVLWKFEENLPNLPANVHILQWAPQQSILSHPNVRLFITHGGLLSTTETVHFGVPIIGIPVFADQFINVERAVKKGFAKRVDLSYTMSDELKVAIEEIVSNPKYRQRVKELSAIYHDRPVSPGKELVHWVEHVVRTRGALHLRSPALHVPWYQKAYLDLAALIVAVIVIVIFSIKRLFLSSKKHGYDANKKMN